MGNFKFFDANVCLGKIGKKHHLQIWKTGDVLHEMKRCGIAGALVYHGLAKHYSPVYGNRVLLDEIKGNERLFGCWVALPHQAEDFPEPFELIAQMKASGIRAARMFPTTYRFTPDERTIGTMLSAFEKDSIPLLLDAKEIVLNSLVQILEAHPDLNLVLLGTYWGQERQLFPIMDEFPKLYIDFSTLQSNRIIENCYARYGAERLIFGTGMPSMSPGAARAFIDYADIPDKDKALIAGGNLVRLTGVEPPDEKMPDQDDLMQQASRGEPLSFYVFDSHTHLIEDGGKCGGDFPMLSGDIDSMVELYNKVGIDRMNIAPWLGIWADSEEGNIIAKKAVTRYPDKVSCYATIDPNYVEDIAAEAAKWHIDNGFTGVKPFYARTFVRYTDKVYEPWWKLANEMKLYALVDPGDYVQFEEDVEELASKYPEISFFMDHAAAYFERAVSYGEIAKKYNNVFLQLTFTSVTLRAIEYLVKEVGAGKILFGTDSPMRDPRPQLGWLAYADISPEDKKAIFGMNMKKILNRCLVGVKEGG